VRGGQIVNNHGAKRIKKSRGTIGEYLDRAGVEWMSYTEFRDEYVRATLSDK
jgi:hypothetical protein